MPFSTRTLVVGLLFGVSVATSAAGQDQSDPFSDVSAPAPLRNDRELTTMNRYYPKQPMWAQQLAVRQQIARDEVKALGYYSMRPNAASQSIYNYPGYGRHYYYYHSYYHPTIRHYYPVYGY
jgi:hypothetical protein